MHCLVIEVDLSLSKITLKYHSHQDDSLFTSIFDLTCQSVKYLPEYKSINVINIHIHLRRMLTTFSNIACITIHMHKYARAPACTDGHPCAPPGMFTHHASAHTMQVHTP